MSRTKKILFAIVLVFLLMQCIRPELNDDSGKAYRHTDVIAYFNAPEDVAAVLKRSCYDCHSNKTRYPWYVQIQPVGWLLAMHVKNGKEDLNFSEFSSYSKRRQLSKLKSVQNSIKDASMPLSSYTMLHPDATLSEDGKAILIQWTAKVIDSLSGQ